MKDTLVAFVLVVVAFIAGMAIGLQKPQPPIEQKPGGLVAPGTALVANEAQISWFKAGAEKGELRLWVNAASDPANVVELVLSGKAIRVAKDGTPIGSVGQLKP